MKRRLTLGLAVPLTVGLIAVGGIVHSPVHTFASAGTPPPPPPTFVPTPVTPPPPPASATPTATATTAPTVAPTNTEVPPVPTNTPKPKKTKTPVPVVQPTSKPRATAVPQPTKQPHTGFGGTAPYVYSSASSNLSHPGGTTGPSSLPRTGGGDGSGVPGSPLAPLTLLAAAAIIAGRALPRLIKR